MMMIEKDVDDDDHQKTDVFFSTSFGARYKKTETHN